MAIRLLQSALSAIERSLPSQCAICRRWPGPRICSDCAGRFATEAHRCNTCAVRLIAPLARCAPCVRQRKAQDLSTARCDLDACAAALDYAYPWDHLITRFKFAESGKADVGLAASLAALMRPNRAIEAILSQADWVVPVPLALARLQLRGFNQSLALAQQLLKGHRAANRVDARLLRRIIDTAPQTSLPQAERLRNVQNAFVVEPLRAHLVKNQRIVLIDDVMTTGASLGAAAAALWQAGASSVSAVVLARTTHS